MKVLSIDLDYIVDSKFEIYDDKLFNSNCFVRWENYFEFFPFSEEDLKINESNLIYCYSTFLKSIKNCDKVSFGYDHDSILYDIADSDNIDIINIDHHDDFFHGFYRTMSDDLDFTNRLEYRNLSEYNSVSEGNWGAWLNSKGKLNSFTWIGNHYSENKIRNEINQNYCKNYNNFEKEDYNFKDYNFDRIFVCLSPSYLPKNHWHYFSMFIIAYENFWGKNAVIHNQKYETYIRYKEYSEKIIKR